MNANNQQADEQILIDFLCGKCDAAGAETIRRRLRTDDSFQELHDSMSNVFAAVGVLREIEPPEDLVSRTLAQVRQSRHMDVLIAREEAGRGMAMPVFSWRELVAVAASVMIVAMLFVPAVQKVRDIAHQARCASNVGQIGTGILTHANDNNDMLPRAAEGPLRWMGQSEHGAADDQKVVSNSQALFRLIREERTPPGVFVCVAAGESAPAFTLSRDMTDFPSSACISYSYQHTACSTARRSDFAGIADKMAVLADATPLFRNGRFERDRLNQANSDNHGGRGQTVLYVDGHVEWKQRPDVGVEGNQIFLAEGIYEYKGTETPVSKTDTFLLPPFTQVASH